MRTSRTPRRLLALAYALMGALGAALLWQWGHPSVLFFGVLLLIVAVSGAAWLLLGAWFERHRPDPVLATAPSGAAATFFPRSRFVIVMGVLLSSALGGWLLAVAAAAYLGGHAGWALFALVLALAVVLAGGRRGGREDPGRRAVADPVRHRVPQRGDQLVGAVVRGAARGGRGAGAAAPRARVRAGRATVRALDLEPRTGRRPRAPSASTPASWPAAHPGCWPCSRTTSTIRACASSWAPRTR